MVLLTMNGLHLTSVDSATDPQSILVLPAPSFNPRFSADPFLATKQGK